MPTIEFSSGGGSVVNGIAGAMQGALAAEQMLQQQRRLALLEQRDAFEQDLARRRFDFLERVDARDFAAQRSDVAFGQDLQRQALDLRRMGTEADIDLGRRRLDLAERQEGRLAEGQAAGLALDERRVGLAEDAAARDAAGAEGVRAAMIDELVRRGDIPKSDIGVYQQLPPEAVAVKFEFFEQARAQQRALQQATTLIDLVFPQADPAAGGAGGAGGGAPDPMQAQNQATRQALLAQLEADPSYAAELAPQLLQHFMAGQQAQAEQERRAMVGEHLLGTVSMLGQTGGVRPAAVGRARGLVQLYVAGVEGITPKMILEETFGAGEEERDPALTALERRIVAEDGLNPPLTAEEAGARRRELQQFRGQAGAGAAGNAAPGGAVLYDLDAVRASGGGQRVDEWLGKIRAAKSPKAKENAAIDAATVILQLQGVDRKAVESDEQLQRAVLDLAWTMLEEADAEGGAAGGEE